MVGIEIRVEKEMDGIELKKKNSKGIEKRKGSLDEILELGNLK